MEQQSTAADTLFLTIQEAWLGTQVIETGYIMDSLFKSCIICFNDHVKSLLKQVKSQGIT